MRQHALSATSRAGQPFGSRLKRLLLRRIWLPRSAYAALPYLYIFLGAYAVLAALYLRNWSWIVPYLVLLGVGCVHAGAYVLSLRRRSRTRGRPNLPE